MSTFELANKILQTVESLSKHNFQNSLKDLKLDLTLLIDQYSMIQNQQDEFAKLKKDNTRLKQKLQVSGDLNRSDHQIVSLLESLGNRSQELAKIKRWCRRQFEKIELRLYEANNYKLLQNIIQFVQSSKRSLDQPEDSDANSLRSQQKCNSSGNQCNQAFFDSSLGQSPNVLNNTNNIIIQTQGSVQGSVHRQGLMNLLNQSGLSLNKKEDLYFKLLKSNQKSVHSGQLNHVLLQDILNVSYSNASCTSSFPQGDKSRVFKRDSNTKILQISKTDRLQDPLLRSLSLSTSGIEIFSPKFQLDAISPIKQPMAQVHSFRNNEITSKVEEGKMKVTSEEDNTKIVGSVVKKRAVSSAGLSQMKTAEATSCKRHNLFNNEVIKLSNIKQQKTETTDLEDHNLDRKSTFGDRKTKKVIKIIKPTDQDSRAQYLNTIMDRMNKQVQKKRRNKSAMQQNIKNGKSLNEGIDNSKSASARQGGLQLKNTFFFKHFMEKMMNLEGQPNKVRDPLQRQSKQIKEKNQFHLMLRDVSKDGSLYTAKRKTMQNESTIQDSSVVSYKKPLSYKMQKY